MKIKLRDIDPNMVNEWRRFFKDKPDFEISHGDIFQEKADAIVSPANSFGFMDGGIDAVYSMRWPHIQGELQAFLLDQCYGELPVGCAVIIPTGDKDIPWLISAPTMRVPMDVIGTVNAFLAFKAVLMQVEAHNALNSEDKHINSILCPGLGTAVGRMPHQVCALQMLFAYKMVFENVAKTPDDLAEAWNSHYILSKGTAINKG